MRDNVIHRNLGAIRFVDATTGTPVSVPLEVKSDTAKFHRTRSGNYVIVRVDGLEAHNDAFLAPPVDPPIGSVTIEGTAIDGTGEYLPRRFTVDLPRDPNAVDPADSLYTAVEIRMLHSPTATSRNTWANVRASIVDQATGDPVPGAFIRVIRVADQAELVVGMSDLRWNVRDPGQPNRSEGELLVSAAGIPTTDWGEANQPVLVFEQEVEIQVVYDPAIFDPDVDNIPDPDALDASAVAPTVFQNIFLASGRTLLLGELEIIVP